MTTMFSFVRFLLLLDPAPATETGERRFDAVVGKKGDISWPGELSTRQEMKEFQNMKSLLKWQIGTTLNFSS